MLMPSPQNEKESMINLNLPETEKRAFKLKCTEQGYNMREALRFLVRQFTYSNKKLPPK